MMAQPYESRRENLLRSYHVRFPLKPKDRIQLEAVGEIMRPTGCSLSEKQDDFEHYTFLMKSVYKT